MVGRDGDADVEENAVKAYLRGWGWAGRDNILILQVAVDWVTWEGNGHIGVAWKALRRVRPIRPL